MATVLVLDSGGPQASDLARDLGRRLAAAAGAGGVVALSADEEPRSVRERTFASREADADVFLALEVAPQLAEAFEVCFHPHSAPGTREVAETLAAGVSRATGASGAVRGALLDVLAPHWHPPGAAALALRLRADARLSDAHYRGRLAGSAAAALAEEPPGPELHEAHAVAERFDVWHEVPLVPQRTGMSCWAAAAAMLVGWRECIDVDPEEVASGVGAWEAYRDGLEPEDVQDLAKAFGLEVEPVRAYGVREFRDLLERSGPLWVGEASPGLHVVVVAGMHGDGTPDGTWVRIADPWPEERGERYAITFRQLTSNLRAAAEIAGGEAQVLHCGGAPRGPRRVFRERADVRVSWS